MLEDNRVLVWVDFLLVVDVLWELVDVFLLEDGTDFPKTQSQRVSKSLAL